MGLIRRILTAILDESVKAEKFEKKINFKQGFRRIVIVLIVITALLLGFSLTTEPWYYVLFIIFGAYITYFLYLALEELLSWVFKGFVEQENNTENDNSLLGVNLNEDNFNDDKVVIKKVENQKKENSISYFTAEKISIEVYPQIYNILLRFFPNSFKTDKEAFDYYESFCARAKSLGEDESIYKCGELLKDRFCIEINVDMLSGMQTISNSWNKNSNIPITFPFFAYDDIKNEELKKEVQQLYYENWEFLESIGMCYTRQSDGSRRISGHLEITPYGLDRISWCGDYNEFTHWFKGYKNEFQIPLNSMLCLLREYVSKEYLIENFDEVLQNDVTKIIQDNKDILRCDVNFQRKSIHIANKYVDVYASVDYFHKPEVLTNLSTNNKYYYFNPFKSDKYYYS